jgi:hypothetical protein
VDKQPKRKKKPNRQARLEKKKEHISAWTDGFKFAYELGYQQALKDRGLK